MLESLRRLTGLSQLVTPEPGERLLLAGGVRDDACRLAGGYSEGDREAVGRGGRPQGGWKISSETFSGSVGSIPCSAAKRPTSGPALRSALEGDRAVSTRGEGESPTAGLVSLGEDEGQESIGLDWRSNGRRMRNGLSAGVRL